MTRLPVFSSPLMLGFDELEQLFDRATRSANDSYPPYNIERFAAGAKTPERFLITLAVAGFATKDLDVTVEGNQLLIRGNLKTDAAREFLHRGIANRQFTKSFVLAEGMEVEDAQLGNGLLTIAVCKLTPTKTVKRIEIRE